MAKETLAKALGWTIERVAAVFEALPDAEYDEQGRGHALLSVTETGDSMQNCCRSREGGNLASFDGSHWVPAFAGTTVFSVSGVTYLGDAR